MAGDPIFLVCQGRSGGSIVAHALAEALPNATLLMEPFHPDLRTHAKAQPKRTPKHLRHHGVTDPWRGYVGVDFTEQASMGDHPRRKADWLHSLVDQVEKRPVIKVTRMWGHVHYLTGCGGLGATVIHLWRDWEEQWKSYSGLGFPRDYFGEWRYGYSSGPPLGDLSDRDFHRAMWQKAKEEGRLWADFSVSLEQVTRFAGFFRK